MCVCICIDPNDPVAQQELLRKSHIKCMQASWISWGVLTAGLLVEVGWCLYTIFVQQWVEESRMHLNKELSSYMIFEDTLFSVFSSRSPSYCYKDLIDHKQSIPIIPQQDKEIIREAVKTFASSMCIYTRDIYFFEEASGELIKDSLPAFVDAVYACGKDFSVLLSRIHKPLVKDLFIYIQRKISFIDLAFQLVENKQITANLWCAATLQDQQVADFHEASVLLRTLTDKLQGKP